jgi:glycosyltransferase involved in cell wall biosynthesis
MIDTRSDARHGRQLAIVAFEMIRSNPSGSTLIDLVTSLAETVEVTVYSSALARELRGRVRFRRVPVVHRGGLIGRLLTYYVSLLFVIGWDKVFGRWQFDIVHGNDSEVLDADYVTFHNCHADCLDLTFRERLWTPVTGLKAALSNFALLVNFLIRSRLERRNVARAKRIYVLTHRQAELVQRCYGANRAIISIRPNYIQQHIAELIARHTHPREELRVKLGVAEHEIALVFVAQGGWRRKGLDLLLDAIARADHPNLRLIVVGGGGRAEAAYYRLRAESLGVSRAVVWLGHQADVIAPMRASDVFVLPSYYEAFSLVSLEALAVGLPIVMTDVSGAHEVIEDGVNGYIIGRDVTTLANTLTHLASDHCLREAFASASRRRSELFTRDRVVSQMIADYWPEELRVPDVSHAGSVNA